MTNDQTVTQTDYSPDERAFLNSLGGYQKVFDAIADATSIYAEGVGINITVKGFIKSIFPHRTAHSGEGRSTTDAFRKWLKPGQTPIERLEQEVSDNDALMRLLAKSRAETAALREVQRLMLLAVKYVEDAVESHPHDDGAKLITDINSALDTAISAAISPQPSTAGEVVNAPHNVRAEAQAIADRLYPAGNKAANSRNYIAFNAALEALSSGEGRSNGAGEDDLIEALRQQAESESKASRILADSKSQRQADNPERSPVYLWVKPEETISWKAADRLAALTPSALSGDAGETERLRTALERIVEVGTRRSVERIGDMYDTENGYQDIETVSEEAEIAAVALAALSAPQGQVERLREALDKRTFLTCVSGDGQTPYLKVHFNNLADAHAAHDELLGRKS